MHAPSGGSLPGAACRGCGCGCGACASAAARALGRVAVATPAFLNQAARGITRRAPPRTEKPHVTSRCVTGTSPRLHTPQNRLWAAPPPAAPPGQMLSWGRLRWRSHRGRWEGGDGRSAPASRPPPTTVCAQRTSRSERGPHSPWWRWWHNLCGVCTSVFHARPHAAQGLSAETKRSAKATPLARTKQGSRSPAAALGRGGRARRTTRTRQILWAGERMSLKLVPCRLCQRVNIVPPARRSACRAPLRPARNQ